MPESSILHKNLSFCPDLTGAKARNAPEKRKELRFTPITENENGKHLLFCRSLEFMIFSANAATMAQQPPEVMQNFGCKDLPPGHACLFDGNGGLRGADEKSPCDLFADHAASQKARRRETEADVSAAKLFSPGKKAPEGGAAGTCGVVGEI